MPPFLIILIAVLFLLVAFVLIRTLLFTRASAASRLPFDADLPALDLDPAVAARHLSEAIKIKTISHEEPAQNDRSKWLELHRQLEKDFPRLHAALKREVLDGYSLLYTWPGSNPELEPVCFMAHQDVVPADETTLDQWTHPPFSGLIDEEFIWGRGTLDIKCQLISTMEAVEALLANGYQPERTILLAFGHDEEVLGTGAKRIVAHLQEQGIRLQSVIDEGGGVYDGIIPGVRGYSASVGVAEKGYLSLKFTVKAHGGHSSTPAPQTAIGILARALDRLQTHQFPYKVKAVLPLFKGLGQSASPLMQVAFANLWLFSGIVRRKLIASNNTAATIHTTTAPTIFHSGVKDNVLPSLAEAVVNFRILPGETIAEVCDRIRKVIADERVTFEPLRGNAWEASPVSPTDAVAYRHISSVVDELFPGTATAPFVMLGGTDARNYYAISSQVYRFCPVLVTKEDIARVHGVNERLSIAGLATMIEFFYRLVPRWASREM